MSNLYFFQSVWRIMENFPPFPSNFKLLSANSLSLEEPNGLKFVVCERSISFGEWAWGMQKIYQNANDFVTDQPARTVQADQNRYCLKYFNHLSMEHSYKLLSTEHSYIVRSLEHSDKLLSMKLTSYKFSFTVT